MAQVDSLAAWHEFYMLSGTASATLVGLMFVAASVGSGVWERPEPLRVFLTATVVHFSSILAISLTVLAPLQNDRITGLLIVLESLIGVAYCGLVLRDLVQRGIGASIDWEDRLWYAALPVTGYSLMGLSGILLATQIDLASAVLALSVLLLLVTGIHNAWDITVWVVTRRRQ